MKLCFSADWHVSNFGPDQHGPLTDRGEACLRVVRRLYALPGVDLHIGLGDIFDLDKPSPGLVRALQDAITVPTTLLVGNHDQSSEESSHHALAPLASNALVVEDTHMQTYGSAQVALVGFRQRKDVICKIAGLEWGASKYRVVGFHLGIADESTPEFLRNTRDSIALTEVVEVCKRYGVTHVFAGNWHNPLDWELDGVRVCQVGGMIPQRFGDPFDEHGRVALFDTETGDTSYEHLDGPRYATIVGEPPWDVELPSGADPLRLRYQIDTKDKKAAIAHSLTLTDRKNTRIEDTRPMSEEFGAVLTISTARESALEKAHAIGGPRLVDYIQECMTRATK